MVPFLMPLVWRGPGSNPGPPAPEADALPFALLGTVDFTNVCRSKISSELMFHVICIRQKKIFYVYVYEYKLPSTDFQQHLQFLINAL